MAAADGASRSTPVSVFRGGRVLTGDAARRASAVAVVDGRVGAVGGDDAVAPYLDRADEIVDLGGRALLPGFLDAHAHPVNAGVERARCDLTPLGDAAAYLAAVGEYVARHPEREWVLGGGWSMDAFPGGRPDNRRLDEVAGTRPVFLPNRDHHSAWVSSAALRRAGIDAGTPDPAHGRIERDGRGEPTGLLHEGAMDLVERVLPATTQGEYDEGLALAQEHLLSLGVVGWHDAWVPVPGTDGEAVQATVHETYLRAQRAGTLVARVSGALWWDRSWGRDDLPERLARLDAVRRAAGDAGDRYRVHSVKIMQDGVLETFTAALVQPYLDACGCATANRGISFFEPAVLEAVVVALDRAGFDLHVHALGDLAVRDALDAIEAARRENGTGGGRHHLAHLQLVQPPDVERLARLGVSANLQPLWACHEPQLDELTVPFLGADRAGRQYPFGELRRAGVHLAMGSDWPVSNPDPIAGVHVAVNRKPPGNGDAEPLGAGQELPLAVALRAYTAGSAWLNRVDDVTGSIRPGAAADLVLLDRDPFSGPPEEIAACRVVRTYVAGVPVHATD